MLCLCLQACDTEQEKAQKAFLNSQIQAGVGIGDILVNKTTLAEIEARFGRAPERKTQESTSSSCKNGNCSTEKKRSLTLSYPQGFWFQSEAQADTVPSDDLKVKRMAVNCIKSKCHFQGKTPEGIGLKSTRQEVIEAFNKPRRKAHNSWITFYRSGLGFSFEGDKMKPDTQWVNQIQVLSPDHHLLH